MTANRKQREKETGKAKDNIFRGPRLNLPMF